MQMSKTKVVVSPLINQRPQRCGGAKVTHEGVSMVARRLFSNDSPRRRGGCRGHLFLLSGLQSRELRPPPHPRSLDCQAGDCRPRPLSEPTPDLSGVCFPACSVSPPEVTHPGRF